MVFQKNKKNILVVDDSKDIHVLLKILLESHGYHVDCTSSGQEALSVLNNSDHLPDLILLDVQMPEMDGFHFRRLQNSNERLKSIPVVVMSGTDDLEMNSRMMNPREVLMKPFKMSSIINCVYQVAPNSH